MLQIKASDLMEIMEKAYKMGKTNMIVNDFTAWAFEIIDEVHKQGLENEHNRRIGI